MVNNQTSKIEKLAKEILIGMVFLTICFAIHSTIQEDKELIKKQEELIKSYTTKIDSLNIVLEDKQIRYIYLYSKYEKTMDSLHLRLITLDSLDKADNLKLDSATWKKYYLHLLP